MNELRYDALHSQSVTKFGSFRGAAEPKTIPNNIIIETADWTGIPYLKSASQVMKPTMNTTMTNANMCVYHTDMNKNMTIFATIKRVRNEWLV